MTEVLLVGPEEADRVLATIHAAFAGRPPLDPPATATEETQASVRDALRDHGGLLMIHEDRPVGALLFEPRGPWLGLRRVGVLPEVRGLGVARRLAEAAAAHAARHGFTGLELEARAELPDTVGFWERLGYAETERRGTRMTMRRTLPEVLRLPEADDTWEAGRCLAAQLRAGDLVILTGGLGAGKTTFTRGLGTGLGVRGPVTSPTFVIARWHPSTCHGPDLVHVDAYRLDGALELDDLDLDTDLDAAVTVVEWGEGLAEALSSDRLEIRLERAPDDVRTLTLQRRGARWATRDEPLLTEVAS